MIPIAMGSFLSSGTIANIFSSISEFPRFCNKKQESLIICAVRNKPVQTFFFPLSTSIIVINFELRNAVRMAMEQEVNCDNVFRFLMYSSINWADLWSSTLLTLFVITVTTDRGPILFTSSSVITVRLRCKISAI